MPIMYFSEDCYPRKRITFFYKNNTQSRKALWRIPHGAEVYGECNNGYSFKSGQSHEASCNYGLLEPLHFDCEPGNLLFLYFIISFSFVIENHMDLIGNRIKYLTSRNKLTASQKKQWIFTKYSLFKCDVPLCLFLTCAISHSGMQTE